MSGRTGKSELRLAKEKDAVAYLRLPTYPSQGQAKVAKNVRLFDCIGQYDGPDLIFDFDEDGVLIGIEILV